ncbi:MAG: acyltransferase [Bacteroidetes bacterium]|nr:acyltransferase [Bacteroidota bacterium]MBS1591533.1 acyltransferase [Bacteroidota bacterium]MBS1670865.1 acyltransferase [Bacteroidota bacterium]
MHKNKKIVSLDGWRAISIIFVLLGHLGGNLPKTHPWQDTLDKYNFSLNGVQVFFVISGFLITTLLLNEKEKTQTVSIGKFYIRRFLRIFPVLYLYIFTVFILDKTLGWQLPGLVYLKAILYLNNFGFWGLAWALGHLWSLAVEEQYYLFWPWVAKKFNYQKALRFCIIFIVFGAGMRVFTYKYGSSFNTNWMLAGFFTFADIIMMGSAAAILYKYYGLKNIFKSKSFSYFLVAISIIAYASMDVCARNWILGFITVPFGAIIQSASIILLIVFTIERKSLFSRFLNTKVMVFIGVCSYSIYVWQQLFLLTQNKDFFPRSAPQYWFSKFPVNIVMIFIVSTISYYCFERFFLKFKEKFSSVK